MVNIGESTLFSLFIRRIINLRLFYGTLALFFMQHLTILRQEISRRLMSKGLLIVAITTFEVNHRFAILYRCVILNIVINHSEQISITKLN